jgi:ribosomal protein L37AE/L43A
MAASRNSERCPHCHQEGYSYDSVCNIWCCGRCQTTETTSGKRLREVAQSQPLEALASKSDEPPTLEGEKSDVAVPVEVRQVG